MNHKRDNSLGEGVYYAECDYAGVVRRLVVLCVDLSLLFFLGVACWVLLLIAAWDGNRGDFRWDPNGVFWIGMIATTWFYLVVLKRSWLRTLGYRVTGVKIVTTRGGRPSLLQLTFRTMLRVYFPFNCLLDLMWIGADSERQSLRDCYANTYLVRADAEPIGRGSIHLVYYTAVCFSLVYPRVVRQSSTERFSNASTESTRYIRTHSQNSHGTSR
ncbi:MAG TPA: RDD family protein [Pirellulaceae bacterium]|nr:RDD family protein [Planctomycetales bacterium]MCB9938203.1 RDD family protein [Planctomycetaceae bacterium]HRX82458.1 RDD family protein [Pirellulaceae bacterium]